MGRRNTRSSTGRWISVASSHPYRASVSGDVEWEIGLPPPDLVAASKVCRGGRLLLAFTEEATRDYFVAGHATVNGCQVEDDHANTASALRSPRGRREAVMAELASGLAEYADAAVALRHADEEILVELKAEMMACADAGDFTKARQIRNAIPDCLAKTLVFSDLGRETSLAIHSAGPPYGSAITPRLARLCATWFTAREREQTLYEAVSPMVRERVSHVLAADGRDAAHDYAMTLPRGMLRAFAADQARYGDVPGQPSPRTPG